jgi:nicotinate-nucleotide pyrophosphorylase (carboxylating)
VDPHTLALKLVEWVWEDAPFGDLTSEALIPEGVTVEAEVLAKSEGIAACFNDLAEALKVLGLAATTKLRDGDAFTSGDVVMVVKGPARQVLLLERTLLNIMTYLSGVALRTRRLIEVVRSVREGVRVAATRKVVPGLRALVKKAVAAGGGDTHRYSLSDAIIIKDNHIAVVGDVVKAVKLVKARKSFIHKVEVEVRTPEDAVRAAAAGADAVMLDNMSPDEVREAIELLKGEGLRDSVIVEVSGGIDEDNAPQYAAPGPDIISSSAITLRPARVDLSMEVVRKWA